MFKNFVSNLPSYKESIHDSKVIEFVKGINVELRRMFEDELDSKKNKQVDAICMHLSKDGSIKAKLEMIEGKKTSKQVAANDESAYKDE